MSPEREGNSSPRRLEVLRERGSLLPGVCNNDPTVLPDWVDINLLKRAKKVIKKHLVALIFCHYCGVLASIVVKSLREPPRLTGKLATVSRAFHRILATVVDILAWYDGEIWNPNPNDPGYKSITKARKIHQFVAIRLNTLHGRVDGKDPLFISQYDMMLSQFAFMGFLVLMPEKIGIIWSDEDSIAILHFWRLAGYLLGMEEEYNILSRPYPEVVCLCQDILQFELKPAFGELDDELKLTAKIAVIWSVRPYFPRLLQGFLRFESIWLIELQLMDKDKDKEMPLTFKDRFAVHLMKVALLLQQNDHIAYLSGFFLRRAVRKTYKNRGKITKKMKEKYGHIISPNAPNEVLSYDMSSCPNDMDK